MQAARDAEANFIKSSGIDQSLVDLARKTLNR